MCVCIVFVFLSVCLIFFFLMIRRPPRSTRTDTLFPYTTLFRSERFDVVVHLGLEFNVSEETSEAVADGAVVVDRLDVGADDVGGSDEILALVLESARGCEVVGLAEAFLEGGDSLTGLCVLPEDAETGLGLLGVEKVGHVSGVCSVERRGVNAEVGEHRLDDGERVDEDVSRQVGCCADVGEPVADVNHAVIALLDEWGWTVHDLLGAVENRSKRDRSDGRSKVRGGGAAETRALVLRVEPDEKAGVWVPKDSFAEVFDRHRGLDSYLCVVAGCPGLQGVVEPGRG